MAMKTLLFVPGDRTDRIAKALASGADVVIIDLEDSVAPTAKAAARSIAADWLTKPRRAARVFVRINPLSGPWAADDIAAIAPSRADGIMLPKAEGAASMAALDAMLRSAGDTDSVVLPIATETPRALFQLGSYEGVPRLAGLTWGAEDLPAAIGATTAREADGWYTPPIEMARALTLFAAHAAGVPAIETVYPDYRDLDGLRRYAERGARDGFTGMMAIHPAQVPVIRAAFTPDADSVRRARAIVDAFTAAPHAGVLSVDGRMVDAPHLKQARALLDRSESEGDE